MKKFMIKLIEWYQTMPFITHGMCRFTPTCSEYMKQAIIEYGALEGFWMGIKRILRCHPFGKTGYDPVIKQENKKNKS